MGRKSNKKKTKALKEKNSNSSIEKLLLTPNNYGDFAQNRYSPDSLKSLRKELKEAITKIYSKYFIKFCERKKTRILTQDPFIMISTEELIIEKNYCNELTQKVKQLVHLDSLNDIYFTFCKSVNAFMSQIYSEFSELKNSDPYLQIACLAEAYFVVENSSRELGKVTSGIFDQKDSYITCENISKLAFLDEVLKHFSEVIKSFGAEEKTELVKMIEKIEKELISLCNKINHLDKESKSQTSQFLRPLPCSNYCIDDIVSYINGDFKEIKKKVNKRRRISKASTAETSGSPFERDSRDSIWKSLENSNALDKEIEEFQCILDSTKPLCHKLRPRISDEWLKKIRNQLIKNN